MKLVLASFYLTLATLAAVVLPSSTATHPPTTMPAAIAATTCDFPSAPNWVSPSGNAATAPCPFGTFAEPQCKTDCANTLLECRLNAAIDVNNAMQETWSYYLSVYSNCRTESCPCLVVAEYEAAHNAHLAQLRTAVQSCNDAYYACTAACCQPWESLRVLPPAVPFECDTLPMTMSRALEACDPPEAPSLNPGPYHSAPECPFEYEFNVGCKAICDINDTECRDAAYQATMTYLTNAWNQYLLAYNLCNDEACRCNVTMTWDALVRFNKQIYRSALDACRGTYDLCCLACCEEIGE